MLHLVAWALSGFCIGALAWLLRPRPRTVGFLALSALAMCGAVFGGLLSWTLWEFPSATVASEDFQTVPVLMSYCLAVFGALAAITMALGAIVRNT